MKNFISYLQENDTETYDFKLKICNIEVDSDMQDKIEHALEAYEVVTISAPKRLPMRRKPLDFPSFDTCEVNLITVSLKYPCTDDQVRQTLSQHGRIPLANLVVIPKNQPEELLRDAEDELNDDDEKEAILTKELENVTGGQVKVGQQRVDSMLKELETRKTEYAAKTKTPKSVSLSDEPMNTKSPVAAKKG